MDDPVQQLTNGGFAWLRGSLASAEEAFDRARALVDARCALDGVAVPRLIGDFVLPPANGEESRDFQTLHFDFGVPLDPKVERDIGRYTALYIQEGFGRVSARTRLVPLAPLLRQRAWPSKTDLMARFVAYGKTHGARNDDHGYVEGSLARLVEAAAGTPTLPSVKVESGFLCGMEFDSLDSERQFFERHSLCLDGVQVDVPLSPADLLVFDNLAVAHGRRGTRRPGELRQWVFGESSSGLARQRELRDYLLAAFHAPASDARV